MQFVRRSSRKFTPTPRDWYKTRTSSPDDNESSDSSLSDKCESADNEQAISDSYSRHSEPRSEISALIDEDKGMNLSGHEENRRPKFGTGS